MKGISILCLMISMTVILSACSDGFPDEAMHFGIEDKVRPYAIVIDPPEAAPGDSVQVTLYAQVPDADEVDITWRVVLDYDLGMYQADEVERNIRDLAVPIPTVDSDGFLSQSFQWVVPDSALLYASALPEILDDPAMVFLAEELIGPSAGSPPAKNAVDAWLKDISLDDLQNMNHPTREATWALADRFACQVRFYATLRTDEVIDVTRNLTIRHTERLHGPNTNLNPLIIRLEVVSLAKANATRDDLHDPNIPQTRYQVSGLFWDEGQPVQIPTLDDHTYYLNMQTMESYFSSPFDPEVSLIERRTYHWYYYRQDDPTSNHNFFVTEDGEDAEMWDLDDVPRLMPAGAGSLFRVVAVTRDFRDNWVMYHATPGVTVAEFILEFQ